MSNVPHDAAGCGDKLPRASGKVFDVVLECVRFIAAFRCRGATFFLSRRVVNRLLQLLQHITCQGAARPAKMREEDKRLNKAGDARWPLERAVNPCGRREGRSATNESGDESPHSKTAAIAFV
ncbi:MAG TPA: hypothetical protein VF278_06965 [Pirellulales bacterium]